jgi:hypothetical protein
MECPDQVLAPVGVDAGLAPDRGVHHAGERGRHLDDANAAQPRRRHPAGEVGRRSPAQPDDRV